VTRSKDTLVLCQPEGNYHVKFQKLNDIEGEAKETERSEMPLEIDEEL
jgi:hypothetical protein